MITTDKLQSLVDRLERIEYEMSGSPDPEAYVRLSREHAEIAPIAAKCRELLDLRSERAGIAEVLEDPATDAEMAALASAEAEELAEREEVLEQEVKILLLPRDVADEKGAILEIRAGTGGEEAALFAGDLFRMYQRFAELEGWKVTVLSASESDRGGYREIVAEVSGRGVFAKLKFESGVHRVQRVPETEASGRIHTSAATVAVLPEAEDVDIDLDEGDLRIDVYRSSGAGGQHVNTTDSAVRITHIPTGIVVACQTDRSQHRNRAEAMRMLRARLYEAELQRREEAAQAEQDAKTDIGWGHQIRSYVLHPYQMVKDLRTEVETSNTQGVLDGDLDDFMAAALAQRVTAQQEEAGETA